MKQPAVSVSIVTYFNSDERCAILGRTCESARALDDPRVRGGFDNGGSHLVYDALAAIDDLRPN